MKKPVKIALIAVMVVLICATTGVMLFAPTNISVQTIERGVLTQDFTENGKLVAQNDYLISSGVGDVVVATLPVLEGQRVKKGDVLVTFEPGAMQNYLESQMEQLGQRRRALEAQKTMSEAQRVVTIEQARAQEKTSQWEYDVLFKEDFGTADHLTDTALENMLQARYTWQEVNDGTNNMPANTAHSLYRQMMDNLLIARANYSVEAKAYYDALVSSSQKVLAALEGSKAAIDSVDAAIGELDASAELLKEKLAPGQIVAPFDGVVHAVQVRPGQPVNPLTPMLSLAAEDTLEVEALLLAADAMTLRVGDMVVCELENGEKFSGAVRFVAAAAQERVSTVGITENRCLVRVTPEKLPEGISAGFGVDVYFSVVRVQDVFAVPLSAVVLLDGEQTVYLLHGGKAVKAPVSTGITANGFVEVTQGLAQGDKVILTPKDSDIKAGTRVNIF